MTLRRKTLLMMTITFAGLIVLLYVLMRCFMLESYVRFEDQTVLRDLDRAVNALQDRLDQLALGLQDWSNWDDTYQFVQGQNPDYVSANLGDDTFTVLNINLMLFVDSSAHVVYGKAVDPDRAWQDALVPAFENQADSARLLAHLVDATAPGYLVVDGEPLMIAAHPILQSDGSGPPVGTLIWGRHLSASMVSQSAERLHFVLDFHQLGQANNPPDVQTAQASLAASAPFVVSPLDSETIGGYALLNDVVGSPSLILRMELPRAIYQQGQQSLTYFLAALTIVGVVFGLLALLLLEKYVLAPLISLSQRVSEIGSKEQFTSRLPVAGDDELARLAGSINALLGSVTQSRAALQQLNGELEQRVADRTSALEQQKTQLETIMDAMGEGLALSVSGKIIYVNRAFAELLDYPAQELVGKPFALLHADADPRETPVARLPMQYYETTLVRSDGTPVNVAITSTIFEESISYDDSRTDTRTCRVIIIRDITQELAAKAQRDYFFARASHDLRTPLTNIMTRLYLLRMKPEELDRHLTILEHVSHQMMALVNDLLDIVRLDQGEMTLHQCNLCLQEVVAGVVETQQADADLRHIALCFTAGQTPLTIHGDATRLRQAITNLVSNAIHYTPEGGRIDVQVAQEDSLHEHLAVVRVADTGVGISTDDLSRIFDPFFRVSDEKGEGSGLGLSIVKEIIDLHGGDIQVSSMVGVGTTFTLRFPLVDIALPSPETIVQNQTISG